MIIFTHIPKTAGTSINRTILRTQLSPIERDFEVKKGRTFEDYLFGNKKFKNVPKYIAGHFPYGIHKCFDTTDYSYFTFLREPVSRWISHFRYSLSCDDDQIKRLYNEEKDFERFLDRCLEEEMVCNVMTKQLSGLEKPSDLILRKKHIKQGSYYVPAACAGKRKYTVNEMQEMLKRARTNLGLNYDFIGLQENYHEDVIRFCEYYKLKAPAENKRFRVGKKDDGLGEILTKEKVRDKIVELNRYDIQLYDYAREHFYGQY
jgi:hypothetical protein